MSFCPPFGSAQDDDGSFCTKCGSTKGTLVGSTSLQRPTPPPPLDPAQIPMASQIAMGTAAVAIHQRIVSNTCRSHASLKVWLGFVPIGDDDRLDTHIWMNLRNAHDDHGILLTLGHKRDSPLLVPRMQLLELSRFYRDLRAAYPGHILVRLAKSAYV